MTWNGNGNGAKLRVWIGILVGVCWGLSVIDSIATNRPDVLGFVTPVMLIVVTGLFAFRKNGD